MISVEIYFVFAQVFKFFVIEVVLEFFFDVYVVEEDACAIDFS